ncbi:MAG: RHS repeat-associated core domain-containing protein [Rubrivivax sp.]|nr:RHS repeat-associated core domain-containing protein [Rubrivivax sp.]
MELQTPPIHPHGLPCDLQGGPAYGSARTRVFDVYGRMVRFPLGGALRDLTYDAADRIIHYTHWDANSGASVAVLNQDFGYDELGRLISISTGAGTWGIGYDDNGNRSVVSYNGPGGPSTRNYVTSASSNWLQSLDNPARSLTYDAAGNLVADVQGTQSISAKIDLSGRVVSISTSGSSASTTAYAHDTFGLRVLKNVKCFAGSTCPLGQAFSRNNWTRFVYDQDGQLLGEYRGDGSVLREYVWLQGMPVAVIDGPAASPQIYYVHTDHLGAPRTVIDRSGVQRWSWVAEPFGNSAPVEDPLGFGAFNLNLRMPGQYFDVESGLAYNWNRSYDAGVGRYTQSDPIGLAGGINTYTYVNGNPIGDVDPTGEFGLLGGLVGGLGDLGYQLYRNGGNLKCVNWWEVGSWALTGSGAGIVGRAGLTGVARFFSNADKFKNISRAYWGARGGANGMSLDHWMISQAAGRSGAVSERLVSGGWNLLEMPASWNTWLGFAPNWGGTQAALANASRLGVQVGVPGVAAASGYAGYQIGTNAQQEQCGCQ